MAAKNTSPATDYKLVVEASTDYPGYVWRQVHLRNGATVAVSPKTYGTRLSATRSAERQAGALVSAIVVSD